MRCGNRTGYVIGTILKPHPKILKMSQEEIRKKNKNDFMYYWGPDNEVYLVDILQTLCDNPFEVFVLYVPHLEGEVGHADDAIVFAHTNKIIKYYYCDIASKGKLRSFERVIK